MLPGSGKMESGLSECLYKKRELSGFSSNKDAKFGGN